MTLKKLDLPVQALYSTLGRTAARTLETKIIADQMQGWYDQLVANIKAGDVTVLNAAKWEPSTWPEPCAGRRRHGSAARRAGALDRDRRRQDRQLSGHRAVRPGTPVRAMRKGNPGPYEAALGGSQLHDAETADRDLSAPSTASIPASPARCM